MSVKLWLVRHGETEWSASGKHTGRTDIALTTVGQRRARELAGSLTSHRFALVLSSPLRRARETCRLAGFDCMAEIESNLREWDYGEYEGRSTVEIQEERPGWFLWRDGVPRGESIDQVAIRARAVIDRALSASGDVLLFAHGHILRILASCWVGLRPQAGRFFGLDPTSVSVLGYEGKKRVIRRWNSTRFSKDVFDIDVLEKPRMDNFNPLRGDSSN